MEKKDNPNRVITGNFEVAVALTDRRSLKMTGYIYNDDEAVDVNTRLDAYQDALDRQAIRSDLVNKEAQIAGHLANLEHLRDSFEGLVAIGKTGKKLTSQQKAQIDSYDVTVANAHKMIEGLRAAIKEGKQKINGVAHV